MRLITLWLLKYNLNRAIKRRESIENDIIKRAYGHMIDNYKHTIMYLKSEIKSK